MRVNDTGFDQNLAGIFKVSMTLIVELVTLQFSRLPVGRLTKRNLVKPNGYVNDQLAIQFRSIAIHGLSFCHLVQPVVLLCVQRVSQHPRVFAMDRATCSTRDHSRFLSVKEGGANPCADQ